MTLRLLIAVLAMIPTDGVPDESRVLTGFSGQDAGFDWYVVNDNVMGGRSDGDYAINDGRLSFSGNTNTRGGGFSSIRARHDELDLSEYSGIRLRVRGDGRRYTWLIQTNAQYRGQRVSFWAEFDTRTDEWMTIDLPFSSFVPKFRGRELRGGPPDPATIRGSGLMINDGQDGPFEIILKSVSAYRDAR